MLLLTISSQTVTCAEDDDFISELEKTMLGELTGRNNSFMKVNSSELALPMNRGFKGRVRTL